MNSKLNCMEVSIQMSLDLKLFNFMAWKQHTELNFS